MKKLIFTFVLLVACCFAAQAQDYKTAVGLRFGYPTSITLKHFISEQGALEGIIGFRGYSGYSWVNIGGLYEHHNAFPDVEGLRWYYGGGASLFFWNFDNGFANDGASNTSIGIMGALGLDYKFANAPVNLSLDWLPTFFVNGYGNGFGAGYTGLSARYTFK